jgi:hypothetical protein
MKLIVYLASAGVVIACSCDTITPEAALAGSDAVFSGTAETIEVLPPTTGWGNVKVTFRARENKRAACDLHSGRPKHLRIHVRSRQQLSGLCPADIACGQAHPNHGSLQPDSSTLRGSPGPSGPEEQKAQRQMITQPNQTLQRTRLSRSRCNSGVLWAGSLSLGR